MDDMKPVSLMKMFGVAFGGAFVVLFLVLIVLVFQPKPARRPYVYVPTVEERAWHMDNEICKHPENKYIERCALHRFKTKLQLRRDAERRLRLRGY